MTLTTCSTSPATATATARALRRKRNQDVAVQTILETLSCFSATEQTFLVVFRPATPNEAMSMQARRGWFRQRLHAAMTPVSTAAVVAAVWLIHPTVRRLSPLSALGACASRRRILKRVKLACSDAAPTKPGRRRRRHWLCNGRPHPSSNVSVGTCSCWRTSWQSLSTAKPCAKNSYGGVTCAVAMSSEAATATTGNTVNQSRRST